MLSLKFHDFISQIMRCFYRNPYTYMYYTQISNIFTVHSCACSHLTDVISPKNEPIFIKCVLIVTPNIIRDVTAHIIRNRSFNINFKRKTTNDQCFNGNKVRITFVSFKLLLYSFLILSTEVLIHFQYVEITLIILALCQVHAWRMWKFCWKKGLM